MQTHLTSHQQRSDPADNILIQQAQAGDHGAFELLVDRYRAVLSRLICHLVRDEHLAQDVLQHVFLQLYRSLPTLRRDGTLKGWLYQVARHRCFDELRRERPLFFSEIALVAGGVEHSPLLMLPDPDRQPQEQVELHELRERLLEVIETLPSRYRAVVLLRYARQLSFREIGQALHIPVATAKTYFHRAKAPLRALLEPECANERGMESCQVWGSRMPGSRKRLLWLRRDQRWLDDGDASDDEAAYEVRGGDVSPLPLLQPQGGLL